MSDGVTVPDRVFVPFADEDLERSLPEVFEEQARAYQDRLAVAGRRHRLTYAELNRTANRVAHAILGRLPDGGEPTRVALVFDHDAPIVAAMIGVLKAGQVCVVLDPSDPAARTQQLVGDSEPALVLTDTRSIEAASALEATGRGLINIDAIDEYSDEDLHRRISPDSAAMILYTSGSTGTPKGVVRTQRMLLHGARNPINFFRIDPDDRVSLLSTLNMAQAMTSAWSALLAGASLHLFRLKQEGLAALAVWINEERLTIYQSSTTVFRYLGRTVQPADRFPTVRVVRIGGEPVLSGDLEIYRRHFEADCVFANVFSTTEAGSLTVQVIDRERDLDGDSVPVGYPFHGKEIRIIDADGRIVERGQIGEITVKSRYLAAGYWRAPGLTDERFLPQPDGDSIFRTGDLGRIDDDGSLEYVGRRDLRVKVRGYRVEIEEIEACLASHPGVVAAAVMVDHDRSGSTRLVAYVSAGDRLPPTAAELRGHVLESLPDQMVPSVFVNVTHMPLTPSGKIDRTALSTLHRDPVPERRVVHARTDVEERLVRHWTDVLRAPAEPSQADTPVSVGVYDNFFEMGGDSLRAADLMARLARELGRTLPMELLINHPSIAQMLEALESGFVSAAGEQRTRPWRASLLALRRTGHGAPLIFIPGGVTSENELLVCAGFLPYLDAEHSVFGVRLNLVARAVSAPRSVGSIARRIAAQVIALDPRQTPILVGECQACSLAFETAQQLSRRLARPPRLVLLDPWQPRQRPPVNTGVPSPAVTRYRRLLRHYEPHPYAGEVHVICSAESQRLQACLDWWGPRVQSPCQGHEVPGNHDTYIRHHRSSLAATINAICDRDRFHA